MEEACGPEVLRHKSQNKVWTAEEKYELVAKVMAGVSNKEVAFTAGINDGLLYQWERINGRNITNQTRGKDACGI